jgi:AcrR family transcriptional regulator
LGVGVPGYLLDVATAEPRPRRRTQEERRTATRGALLDATIDTLVEYGYGGVTTTRVVERAGVSRGAQVHHFPTKAVLVSEALKHLATRRAEEVLRRVSKLPEGTERLDAVLELMWASHSGPLFQAALELWVAARTDPELRVELVEVERQVAQTVWSGAAETFGEYASRPGFDENLEFALAAMRGLALLDVIAPDRRGMKRRWAALRARLRRMFEED